MSESSAYFAGRKLEMNSELAKQRSRAIASLLGLAVGDAVGTTLEFTRRDSRPPLTDMVGGGPFGLKPGEWTDDTSMALCLADSLIAREGAVDARHLLTDFCNWWQHGWNSVTGQCFDIGFATREALASFQADGLLSNNQDERRQANGSIMRLAPVVICASSIDRAILLAQAQGRTTHAAPVPQQCCAELAKMLWETIETGNLPSIVRGRGSIDRDEVVSSGHAPATLTAACWAVASTSDFRSAILAAVNLGDDADTVGAVTGQIAGALYGEAGIPDPWLRRLAWRQDIADRAARLWALRGHASG